MRRAALVLAAGAALSATAVLANVPPATAPVPVTTAPAPLIPPPAPASAGPSYGPPSKWVLPAEVPDAPPPVRGGIGQVLLDDEQSNFGPNGDEMYLRHAIKVLTPEGLAPLGGFHPSWDPATESLTIHHVRIIRGAEVIDALEGGKGVTVLRRETNLERAALDGRLTASLQLSGLRVGDVIDIATTLRRRDPAIGDHSQGSAALVFPGVAAHIRYRAIWPDGKTIRWRQTEGLPAPVVTHAKGQSQLLIDLTNVKAPIAPINAPPRYRYMGRLEMTQFASWSEISRIISPLFAKAEVLAADSPVKAEAQKIRASAPNNPPLQTALALALVERGVRYQFIGLNDGGYVPAAADETWTRRFGDCKGKTVLLIALLNELGIEAEPVLVSTTLGDGLDQRLPMLNNFDHVIVHAHVGTRWFWLDGTRPIDSVVLQRLLPPPFRWGLPLRPGGAELIPIDQAPAAEPLRRQLMHIDASAGFNAPAPTHFEIVARGDEALKGAISFAGRPHDDMERSLRQSWSQNTPWLDIQTVDWKFDPVAYTFTIKIDGLAHLDWRWNRDVERREYFLTAAATAPKGLPRREPGPDQDAPYAIAYPSFEVSRTEVVLPKAGDGFATTGGDYDKTLAGMEFRRTVSLDHGVAVMEFSSRSLAREFPAADIDAVNRFYIDLNDDSVAVRGPKGEDAPGTTAP